MRDDLFILFRRLILVYRDKLACLNEIKSNEIQLRYLLRSGNEAGINDLLQEDKDIFIKLDSIEFDVRSIVAEICKISGIKEADFKKFFLTRDEDPLPEAKKLKDIIDIKTADLIKERDELINDMGNHLAGIKADIDSLQKIRGMNFKKM